MAAAKAGESVVNCEMLEGLEKRMLRAVNAETIIERFVVVRRIFKIGGSGFCFGSKFAWMTILGARTWKISRMYNINSTFSSMFTSRLNSASSSNGIVCECTARSHALVSFSAAFRRTKSDSSAKRRF